MKALFFAAFGIFLMVPVLHLLLNNAVFGTDDTFSFVNSVPYIAAVGASYLFGLYVYTVQCPERHAPGKFDVCGHSHQIWHLLVVSGIFFTYLLALTNFEERKLNVCPATI